MTLSFEGYTPLHLSCLSTADASVGIPPETILTGKLKMLWPLGASSKISLALISTMDPAPNAYQASSSPSSSNVSKLLSQKIRLDLSPTHPITKGRVLEYNKHLATEYERLNEMLASMVQVDVSGMRFERYVGEGEARMAVLQGSGSRMIGVIGEPVMMLELDLPPPSKTPSWLPPPSPAPDLSPSKSHIPIPRVHTNISATDITTTRYRPLSAFQNQFTIPTSDAKGTTRNTADSTDLSAIPTKRRKISPDHNDASDTIQSIVTRVIPLGPPSDSHLGQGAHPEVPPMRESFLPESGSTIESIQGSTHPSPAPMQGQSGTGDGGAANEKGSELGNVRVEEVMPSEQDVMEVEEEDMDVEAAIREAEEYVKSQLLPRGDEMAFEQDQAEISLPTDQGQPSPKTLSARPGSTAPPPLTTARPQSYSIANPVTPSREPAAPGPGPSTSRQSLRRQAELVAIAKAQSAQAEAEKSALADRISLEALTRDLIIPPKHLPPGAQSGDGRRLSGGRVYLDPIALGGIGYTTIGNMRHKLNGSTGIIGVVLDISGYKQTSKGDWICTIIITDPSVKAEDANSNEDFLVTVFRKAKEELPVIPAGTPILFRGVRVTEFNSKPKGQAYSNDLNTYATLIDGKVEYEAQEKMKPPLVKEEVERLAGMGRWWKEKMGEDGEQGGVRGGSGGNRVSLGAVGRGKRPLLTLGEIRDGVFCDVVFKILHVAPNSRGTPALELYITDGTPSPLPLRNFHNITHPQIPLTCIYQMAIYDKPSADEIRIYESGNVLVLRNVRPKVYKGELELSWSELVTDFQAKEGWNRRRVGRVGKDEERAKEIERRLAALRKGEEPISTAAINPSPAKAIPTKATSAPIPVTSVPVTVLTSTTTAPAPVSDIPISLTLTTVHTDPIRHPLTSLSEVDQNQTVPNRFKVRARVEHICSVGKKGGGWVLKWCMHCKRSFDTPFCQSCNDTTLINAEYRYRFLVVLSPHLPSTIPLTLPVLVGDTDASAFLPPLPPLKSTSNPNDQRTTHNRLNGIYRRVEQILMGNNMDGARQKPITEFCVESYLARPRKGKGQEVGEGVKVFRLFGMKGVE